MEKRHGEVAVAAANPGGNVRLRRAREALQRTQEEIVEDLAACADRMHKAGRLRQRLSFSLRQYEKWESSCPPWPRPQTRKVLEEFFRRPIGDLGFASQDHGGDEEPESAAPRSVAPSAAPAPAIGSGNLPWLAPTGSVSGSPSRMRIGEAEVELLRAAADDMDQIDQQFGGNRLWRSARAHLLWVHQMLDRGVYDEVMENQLRGVAGKFTTSLGWFCYDAGLQAEARTYFAEALTTATYTGDDALASRTLSNMSRQAVDLGKGREAVRFARLAQAHAAEWSAPPRVEALLAIRQAQGFARLGDALSCEKSIRYAWRAWEQGPDERDPDWVLFLNEAEIVCLEGMCRLDLQQYARAQQLLEQSAGLQDLAHSRNRGMCLGRLAVAALRNRDLGHSLAAVTESLRLVKGGMSSTRATHQLVLVRDGLAPHHRSRGVQDALDEISEHVA
ncbi:hypothetical protein RM780_11865 [Streptomyces sp. DSM 44917]|uniref:Regulatory protein n=1 Tax=Streptomyces boetiae TaxID=3075541 RepID=A0ABU2L7W3_9ACTN|nr:hypothetical protein [Streptomyces sp. DSM 44917]MDT0307656.1 hypothetical protein [Streptomyces sp. DSM 44917]